MPINIVPTIIATVNNETPAKPSYLFLIKLMITTNNNNTPSNSET